MQNIKPKTQNAFSKLLVEISRNIKTKKQKRQFKRLLRKALKTSLLAPVQKDYVRKNML